MDVIFKLTRCLQTVHHILDIAGFSVPEDGMENYPHEVDPRQL